MNALGTFPIKQSTFKKRIRKAVSEAKGIRREEKIENIQEKGRKVISEVKWREFEVREITYMQVDG